MAEPSLRPLDVLWEDEGLPAVELPAELRRLYGGDLGLPERCVYANFVSTLEGVVAIPALHDSNRLVSMDSEADRFVMGLLRAFADVVLIGSGVLRASPRGTWRPQKVFPPGAEPFADLRRALGKVETPEVAVLTGTGSIDAAHPVFASGAIVLTSTQGAATLAGRLPPAQVLVLGEEPVLAGKRIVDALAERGHRHVLSEAGPHTFGALLAARAVDELFLTVAPLLVGSGEAMRLRLVEGPDLLPFDAHARLASVRRHEQHLFLRYALSP